MKFLSVNNFVNATMKIEPNTTQINIVFSVRDALEDKFGKVNAIPLLIFITKANENTKEILNNHSLCFQNLIV